MQEIVLKYIVCFKIFITVNIEDPLAVNANKRQRVEREVPKPKKVVVVGADPELVGSGPVEKERGEKATDDFHFEKFKKQFRRF